MTEGPSSSRPRERSVLALSPSSRTSARQRAQIRDPATLQDTSTEKSLGPGSRSLRSLGRDDDAATNPSRSARRHDRTEMVVNGGERPAECKPPPTPND